MTREETLIAAAKALAGPVVAWIGEDEPLGYLIGNRTWHELAALVAVLGEVIANSTEAQQVLAKVLAASDGYGNESRDTKWSRHDDGIVDDVAIARVAAGESTPDRPVPLSPPERLRAAEQILAEGGGASLVGKRLHVSGMTAWDLLGHLAAERPTTAEETADVA